MILNNNGIVIWINNRLYLSEAQPHETYTYNNNTIVIRLGQFQIITEYSPSNVLHLKQVLGPNLTVQIFSLTRHP